MGTKFAHFSIQNSSLDETIELLQLIPQRKLTIEKFNSFGKMMSPGNWKPIAPEAANLLEGLFKQVNLSQRTFFVGSNEKWITVFNDDSGVSAESNAMTLSKLNSKTFLVISDFDDDVFQLVIIKDGIELTRHVSGNAEAYGMSVGESFGDLDIIANTLEIANQKEQLRDILKKDNVFQKIPELEKLIGMTLWIPTEQQMKEMGWKRVVISEASK
jgi:hypothetical protein